MELDDSSPQFGAPGSTFAVDDTSTGQLELGDVGDELRMVLESTLDVSGSVGCVELADAVELAELGSTFLHLDRQSEQLPSPRGSGRVELGKLRRRQWSHACTIVVSQVVCQHSVHDESPERLTPCPGDSP